MSRVVQTVRFVVGLAMLVAGVIVAGPYASSLVAAHGRRAAPAPPPETVAWVQQAAQPAMAPVAAPPMQAGQPHAVTAPGFPEPLPHEVPTAPFVPRGDYRPPSPPAALPPLAMDLTRSTPAIDASYRSTLDIPPPPLLDADTPPPLSVAWSANSANAARARGAAAVPQGDASAYVVRDGDDLTSIAVKLYGHAGGAQAIWSVNRDRLSDPNVLPIGLELRIPPAWSVPAVQHNPLSSQVIEPARRPAKVRVGAGETLESLAQRFYGDRSMAPRLFEANRDLLRNPQLVVAGMELRLP